MVILAASPFLDQRTYPRLQLDVVNQLRKRLSQLRIVEESLEGPVDSVVIEHQLERLAKRAGVRLPRALPRG